MAYDASKEKDRGQQATANPYADLTAAMSPTEAAAPIGGALSGAGAPTATGHVNFDQVYNANEGVAAREAGKLASSTEAKAKGVQGQLTGVQNQYQNQLNAGYTQAPTSQQQQWAAQRPAAVPAGKQVMGAGAGNKVTGQQGYVSEQGEGLDAGGYLDKQGNWVPTTPTDYGATSGTGGVRPEDVGKTVPGAYDPANAAADEAAVRAGAAGKFGGPASLSALDAYGDLTKNATAAEQAAQALGSNTGIQSTGMNSLDASLLGAAGRPRFSQLAQQYGDGALNKQIQDANARSIEQSKTASAANDANVNAYKSLLGEHDAGNAAHDADQAAEDARTRHSGDILADANKGPANDWHSNFNASINGSGEQVWPDGQSEHGAATMGANRSFQEARDPKNTYASMWAQDFGVAPADSQYVLDNMTEADWGEYQKAAATGPDAVKKWFDAILGRRK